MTQQAAAPMPILFAGYGVYNATIDVTEGIQGEYRNNRRVFQADNRFGDPAPGSRKYLYIQWKSGGNPGSGVTGEDDDRGINVP